MNWFTRLFRGGGGKANDPEAIVRFYQQLGFLRGADPTAILRRYAEDHGNPPDPAGVWDQVFLLAYSEGDVWSGDPEADVCAGNEIYPEVLEEWARLSGGAFSPVDIREEWAGEEGPITLSFGLGGHRVSVMPSYQEDWVDLEVLRQVNGLIAATGRQFECAVDGNFALVLSLTAEQKAKLRAERQFPFAW